jgi:hypothetical protein
VLDGRQLEELDRASGPVGAGGVLTADRDGYVAVLGAMQVGGWYGAGE